VIWKGNIEMNIKETCSECEGSMKLFFFMSYCESVLYKIWVLLPKSWLALILQGSSNVDFI
jgi:hypothetical protein